MNDEHRPAEALQAYGRLLLRWSWLIFLCGLVGASGAYLVAARQPDVYRAAATVQINDPATGSVFSNRVEVQAGETSRFLVTQIEIVKSQKVAALAAQKLDTSISAAVAGVKPTIVAGTTLMAVVVDSTSPTEAREKANAFAEAYLEQLRLQALDNLAAVGGHIQAKIRETQAELDGVTAELELAREQGSSIDTIRTFEERRANLQNLVTLYRTKLDQEQIDVAARIRSAELVSLAELPLAPIAPTPSREGSYGLVLGLLAGVGLVLLVDRLDDALRTPERARRVLGCSELAIVPNVEGWRRSPGIVLVDEPASPAAETFRILRTNLRFSALPRSARMIVVTSAGPEEGKTTIATNLAWALADSGAEVVLVDGDIRQPNVHARLRLPNTEGLTSAILGERLLVDLFQRPAAAPDTLRVITSGPVPPNPSELLGLDRTKELFETFGTHCDFVIVDSAPVVAVSDGLILSRYSDAVIYVADASRTTIRGGVAGMDSLRRIEAPVIGFVLNRCRPTDAPGGYGYGSYYHSETGRRRRGRAAAPMRP